MAHASYLLGARPTVGSGFGWRNAHTQFHDAVDLLVGYGTPVYAPLAGRVVRVVPEVFPGGQIGAAWVGGGRMVQLQHDAGDVAGTGSPPVVTTYLHLARTTVSQGDRVQAGALIGYAGDSKGLSLGQVVALRGAWGGHPTDDELRAARAVDDSARPVSEAAVAQLRALDQRITRANARDLLGRLRGDHDTHLHFGVKVTGSSTVAEPGAPPGTINPLPWLEAIGVGLGAGSPPPIPTDDQAHDQDGDELATTDTRTGAVKVVLAAVVAGLATKAALAWRARRPRRRRR